MVGVSTIVRMLSAPVGRWRSADDRQRALQVVQPGLIGLIDGTISTLAPIFATAYIAGSHAALMVGIAAALGAAISMGLSEGLSDDGELTGRGAALTRGLITGGATFLGGTFHALPFLIGTLSAALTVAYVVVGTELLVIAWIRRRFLHVPLSRSLIQVTAGGALVAVVGALLGHA
jgi:VIT1/CCC1 family predicted Fe2+/Mn2+ transporter